MVTLSYYMEWVIRDVSKRNGKVVKRIRAPLIKKKSCHGKDITIKKLCTCKLLTFRVTTAHECM